MGSATLTDGSLLNSYQREWRIVGEHSCNVLLEGDVTKTDALLRLMHPHLREPIHWHRPHVRFDVPRSQRGTLIVRDAGALSADDQRRLLGTGSTIRIISTTPRPLFALVEAGVFDATLYYRLNIMMLRVQPSHHAM